MILSSCDRPLSLDCDNGETVLFMKSISVIHTVHTQTHLKYYPILPRISGQVIMRRRSFTAEFKLKTVKYADKFGRTKAIQETKDKRQKKPGGGFFFIFFIRLIRG